MAAVGAERYRDGGIMKHRKTYPDNPKLLRDCRPGLAVETARGVVSVAWHYPRLRSTQVRIDASPRWDALDVWDADTPVLRVLERSPDREQAQAAPVADPLGGAA